MSTQEAKDRLELLQGTLDVLILRTLIFGPQHGQGIARPTAAYAATEAPSYPISRREAISSMAAMVNSVTAIGNYPVAQ
jgi:hypothetical protein